MRRTGLGGFSDLPVPGLGLEPVVDGTDLSSRLLLEAQYDARALAHHDPSRFTC